MGELDHIIVQAALAEQLGAAHARIKKLEAALRWIIDTGPAYRGELSIKIARRALDGKNHE